MMVYKGLAYVMVSGAVNTTAQTIRPALKLFLFLHDRVLVYGDCAIVPSIFCKSCMILLLLRQKLLNILCRSRA
ncbi:MAG: phosphate acyltransferase [Candidatus Walczuchella monophlebidarum]